MSNRAFIVGCAVLAATTTAAFASQQSPAPPPAVPTPAAAAPTRSGGIPVPTITLMPGLSPVPNYNEVVPPVPAPDVPAGFTSLFNGRDLSGWHISKTARHGRTPDFHVRQGVLIGTQQPYGQGGILVTDRTFRNFELTLDVKPDWGCDSGIFLRTTEAGAAYQITMDYLGTGSGSLGRFIGEGGISMGARGAAPPTAPNPAVVPAADAWKREEWNRVRVRLEGEVPHIQVWINDKLVTDQQDTANHAPGGMYAGPIALQVHGGTDRWVPGGFWRWKNIGIRELP